MILLDTQAAAWLVTRPQRLSRPAAEAIRRHAGRNELAVASVTLMELGLMLASGEIRSTGTPQEWLRAVVSACIEKTDYPLPEELLSTSSR